MVKGLPDATRVVFDDERAVANAGVLLPAVLAERLGIEALVDRTVDLGDRKNRASRAPRFSDSPSVGLPISSPWLMVASFEAGR